MPIQNENLTQNLRDYVEYRVEVLNANNESCGILEWFYDAEKTRRKAELIFNSNYNLEFRSWYENGELKKKNVGAKMDIQIWRFG